MTVIIVTVVLLLAFGGLLAAAYLSDRPEAEQSPFAEWEMPPEIAHEERTATARARERYHEEMGLGAEFFAAPTITSRTAPPVDGTAREAPDVPGPEAALPTAQPEHALPPGAPQGDAGPESEPQQATVPAPPLPDPFSAAFAAVRAIQELTTDEYAAKLAAYDHSDATDSFAAIAAGWS